MPPKKSSSSKDVTEQMASMSIKQKSSSSSSTSPKKSDDAQPFDSLPDDILLKMMIKMDDDKLHKFIQLSKKLKKLFDKNKRYIHTEKFTNDGILRGHENIDFDQDTRVNVSLTKCLTWNSKGTKILGIYGNNRIVIWYAQTGLVYRILQEPSDDFVFSVAWSPNGKQIVSGSDIVVRIWDVATGEILMTLQRHTNIVTSVEWSPDGTRIASGSFDENAIIWDAFTGTRLHTLGYGTSISTIAWSPDSKQIALAGGGKNIIEVWEADAGSFIEIPDDIHGTRALAWSPDGKMLAVGSIDETINIWNIPDVDDEDDEIDDPYQILEGKIKNINSIVWNKAGTQIASAGDNKKIEIWDVENETVLVKLEGEYDRRRDEDISSVSWSPDGKKIVSNFDKSARIIDISKLLQTGGKTRRRSRKTVKKI